MGPPLQGRRSTVRRLTAAQEDKATSHTPKVHGIHTAWTWCPVSSTTTMPDYSGHRAKGLDTPVSRSLHAAAKHDTWV